MKSWSGIGTSTVGRSDQDFLQKQYYFVVKEKLIVENIFKYKILGKSSLEPYSMTNVWVHAHNNYQFQKDKNAESHVEPRFYFFR